jgi:hypothetical protein
MDIGNIAELNTFLGAHVHRAWSGAPLRPGMPHRPAGPAAG